MICESSTRALGKDRVGQRCKKLSCLPVSTGSGSVNPSAGMYHTLRGPSWNLGLIESSRDCRRTLWLQIPTCFSRHASTSRDILLASAKNCGLIQSNRPLSSRSHAEHMPVDGFTELLFLYTWGLFAPTRSLLVGMVAILIIEACYTSLAYFCRCLTYIHLEGRISIGTSSTMLNLHPTLPLSDLNCFLSIS